MHSQVVMKPPLITSDQLTNIKLSIILMHCLAGLFMALDRWTMKSNMVSILHIAFLTFELIDLET